MSKFCLDCGLPASDETELRVHQGSSICHIYQNDPLIQQGRLKLAQRHGYSSVGLPEPHENATNQQLEDRIKPPSDSPAPQLSDYSAKIFEILNDYRQHRHTATTGTRAFQQLLQTARSDWAKEVLKLVDDVYGDVFENDKRATEMWHEICNRLREYM